MQLHSLCNPGISWSSLHHRRSGLLPWGGRSHVVVLHRPKLVTTTRGDAAAVEAPTSPPNVEDSPAAAAQPAAETGLFDWYKAWYPLAALEALKPDAPNAVQLLGARLVVWQDGEGAWQCFEDLCPHRLAPLSEGRIHESGQLQCTYHGWLFDSRGGCTSIPQIPDEKAHATACGSSRACVKSFQTQVLHGILWVCGNGSRQAAAAGDAAGSAGTTAAAAPPRPSSAAAELLEGGWELKAPWFQRDIPLSVDVLLENMTDPSHVPQSHHGVMGDRASDQRMTITPCDGGIKKEGFKVLVENKGWLGRYEFEYLAPALVKYHFPGVTMLLYATPTDKGWSRVIMSFIGPKGSKRSRPATPQLPPLVNWLIDNVIDPIPALQHAVNRNPIIDGDSYFMHVAERALYSRGDHSTWSRQYYMPATADLAVMYWRKWLDGFGAALPVLPASASDLPPLLPREVVFDRLNQHTKHCPHCSAALRSTNVGIFLLAAVAAIAGGAAAIAAAAAAAPGLQAAAAQLAPAGATALWKLAGAAAAVAAVAGAAAAGLLRFRRLFIFEDYVHAHR